MPSLDEVKIGITAELANFKASLAELPDIGKQEAQDMVRGIQRALKEADKAAKDTGKVVKDEVGGGLEEAGDAAEFLKGKFNETFGVAGELITDFLPSLGSATTGMSGLGAAGLAAGVGIGAAVASSALLATAAKSIADSALEARDRLVEQGRAAELPPDALRSLRQYELASGELSVALDKLTVTLGGKLGDDLAVIASGLADLVTWTSSAVDATDDLALVFARQIPLLGPLADVVASLWGHYSTLTLKELEADAATREHEKTQQDMLIQLGLLDDQVQDNARHLSAYTEVRKEATNADAEASTKAEEQHEAYLAAVLKQTAADLESAKARVKAAEDVENAIESERKTYIDAYRQREQVRLDDIASEEERTKALEASWLQSSQAAISSTQSIADAIVAGYERRASEGEKLSEAEKEAALRSFAISQAAAMASATMSATIIGVNTIKSLTDLLVPFPIALAAGLAATASVLSGQVASIASTPPPEFPTGRSPDHRLVGVQDEELIASRRASRMPEVREAVRQGNRGVRPAVAAPAEVGVHVSMDRRLGRLRITTGRVGKKPPRRR